MQNKGAGLSSVLYIEDDSMNLEIVNMFLKGYYLIDTASEAFEAMEKIHANKYAVILLDISLGRGSSGLELAKEIKNVKNYQDVPIIAVTAHALREDENRILKGACTHYVAKPFTKRILLDTLKKALSN